MLITHDKHSTESNISQLHHIIYSARILNHTTIAKYPITVQINSNLTLARVTLADSTYF